MDPDSTHLLQWLQNIAANSNLPPRRRNKAMYISVSFNTHRNAARLAAQVAEFTAGDMDIAHCYGVRSITRMTENTVDRHIERLQSILTDFGVVPNIADFEGHTIELISTLPAGIENLLRPEKRLDFHRDILHLEKEANESLNEYTNKYGYHYIFRTGLRNYYMTRSVVKHINFWRPDPRGAGYREFAQRLCYEAIEKHPALNPAEKRVIIIAIRCFPEDALRFWNWITKYRMAYYAMRTCITLLEEQQCKL